MVWDNELVGNMLRNCSCRTLISNKDLISGNDPSPAKAFASGRCCTLVPHWQSQWIKLADVWMWLPREVFRFWVLAITGKSLAIGILDEETIWKNQRMIFLSGILIYLLLLLPRSIEFGSFSWDIMGFGTEIFGAHPVSFVKRRDHLTKHLLDKSLSNGPKKKGSILGCFSSLGWRTHLWFVRDFPQHSWNLKSQDLHQPPGTIWDRWHCFKDQPSMPVIMDGFWRHVAGCVEFFWINIFDQTSQVKTSHFGRSWRSVFWEPACGWDVSSRGIVFFYV